MRLRHLIAVVVLSTATLAAHATTVTFDTQAANAFAPSAFDGGADSPLPIGIATFRGGELLLQESGAVDQTGVYATALFDASTKNPLTITFSAPVTGFSLVLTNNSTGTFTVSDNFGSLMSMLLGVNAFQTFNLTDNGITSVSIAQTTGSFDFAIDNVNFTPATVGTVTPEPTPCSLVGTGMLALFGMARRRLLRN